MARFYLESDVPARDQKKAEMELRDQVGSMIGHTGFKGKLDPRTANIEVVKSLATPILREFQETAAKRGTLIAEEFTDSQGRTCTRYHGDARAGLAPFAAPGKTCRVSPLSNFEGKVFLKGQEPLAVKRAMLLRSNGLE
jgi:hypothetical protein